MFMLKYLWLAIAELICFLKFFNHGAIVEEWPVEAAKKGILSFFFPPLKLQLSFSYVLGGVSSDWGAIVICSSLKATLQPEQKWEKQVAKLANRV